MNKSDVADLVDDQQRDPAQLGQLAFQSAGVVGFGEAGDPLGGGGERGAVDWDSLVVLSLDDIIVCAARSPMVLTRLVAVATALPGHSTSPTGAENGPNRQREDLAEHCAHRGFPLSR